MLLFLLLSVAAIGQSNTISVRLYNLHPQQHLRIAARQGNFQWRSCEHCAANPAGELILQANHDRLKLTDGTEAQQIFVEGSFRLEPEQGLRINLSSPLRVTSHEGLLTLITQLPLEDYVSAALQGESAVFGEPESLKAMAVVVRSYAARFRPRHGDEGFDLCDNTHCQNLNLTGSSAKIRAAVAATRGQMLWYKGSPAATYYHQNCGGTLAAGEEVWPTVHEPYLKTHVDTYCKTGSPLPWTAEFSRVEFEAALRKQGLTVPDSWTSLVVESRGASGRALRLAFRSQSQPPLMISASSLRFAIGRSLGWNRIRSDLYEVESNGQSVVFRGSGAGHGVGLCQAGAEEMAHQGKTYKEILSFYYPGTQLGQSAQGLEWQTRESDAFQLKTTQPEADADLLAVAGKVLDSVQAELKWNLNFKVQLRVFPTLEAYRNTTGQPGYIAAYTRGNIVSLQPLAALREKANLESTLRHEFIHLMVESRASAETPLWYREGLVLYLSDPSAKPQPVTMPETAIEATLEHRADRESMQRAYSAARTRVAQLVNQNGREIVLHWLSAGLPGDVRRTSSQH
jgi:stage II sporulation protein D